MSIKEVCFQCGFQSPQYFSRIFKQQMGVSPRDVGKIVLPFCICFGIFSPFYISAIVLKSSFFF